MRFIRTGMFIILFFFMTGLTAFAGSINEHEQRIIDTVSTPVTHNKKEYVAKEQYVARLTAYLNQDNVDLTKEQADLAIQKFFESIELGIKEGYMEEVKEPENSKEPEKDNNKKPEKDNKTPESEKTNTEQNKEVTNTLNNKNENNASSDEESDEIKESVEADTEILVSTEAMPNLQKERDMVEMLLEEYSLPKEEADVYAELEAVESSMEAVKDYSDAEPFQKGISLGMVAVMIVIVVAILMIAIICVHKSKRYTRK